MKNSTSSQWSQLWQQSKPLTNLKLRASGSHSHNRLWEEPYNTMRGFWPISLKSKGHPQHTPLTDPWSWSPVLSWREWKADFSLNSGLTVQGRAEASGAAHTTARRPLLIPTPSGPQWRTHSRTGRGQGGPSRYLRVEERAKTQGQYWRVTEGLCAKYHGLRVQDCQSDLSIFIISLKKEIKKILKV